MMCPNCGVMVGEGRNACPNCGTPVQQISAYDQVAQGQGSGYSVLRTREMENKRNRSIGIVLIIIGIIFMPLAILTIYMPIDWIFCLVASICLLAGIITIATNLR